MLKQGYKEVNCDFVRCFYDLLSTKAMLPKELKRDLFMNALHPKIHVEVLKMDAITCDSAIAKCLVLKAMRSK